jgi:hypothetical protein
MYDGHVVATITRYSNNFGSGQAENTTNELLGAGQQVTGGSNSESGNTNGATGGAEQ